MNSLLSLIVKLSWHFIENTAKILLKKLNGIFAFSLYDIENDIYLI